MAFHGAPRRDPRLDRHNGLSIVDHHAKASPWAEHAKDLLSGARRVRGVVNHSPRIEHVKQSALEWEAFRVRHVQVRGQVLGLEALARRFEARLAEVDSSAPAPARANRR